jgi:hypothetical protein
MPLSVSDAQTQAKKTLSLDSADAEDAEKAESFKRVWGGLSVEFSGGLAAMDVQIPTEVRDMYVFA